MECDNDECNNEVEKGVVLHEDDLCLDCNIQYLELELRRLKAFKKGEQKWMSGKYII